MPVLAMRIADMMIRVPVVPVRWSRPTVFGICFSPALQCPAGLQTSSEAGLRSNLQTTHRLSKSTLAL